MENNRACKFTLPLDVLVHNTNYFTKKASLDLVVDETSVPFGGCGEMISRSYGKMCTRGAQLALLLDVGTMRCRGYYPRHKLNPYVDGMTRKGTSELLNLINIFIEPNHGPGKLWEIKPHLTTDNFFVDLKSSYHLGRFGYGMTATLAKNYLPKIPSQYFHKEDVTSMYPLFYLSHT